MEQLKEEKEKHLNANKCVPAPSELKSCSWGREERIRRAALLLIQGSVSTGGIWVIGLDSLEGERSLDFGRRLGPIVSRRGVGQYSVLETGVAVSPQDG